jgi:putative ABC transport system permease protein
VERKRRTLALLRLMGLSRWAMVMMPVWQALLYALLGTLAASAVALGAAEVVNALEIVGPAGGRALARIGPAEVGAAAGATALAAMLAALLAARRVAAIDPAEGLRDG